MTSKIMFLTRVNDGAFVFHSCGVKSLVLDNGRYISLVKDAIAGASVMV